MTKPHRPRKARSKDHHAGAVDMPLGSRLVHLLRSLCLFGVVLATTGRVLMPSEDAETGSGWLWLLVQLSCAIPLLAQRLLGETAPLGRMAWGWIFFLPWLALSAVCAQYHFPAVVMAWEWLGVAVVWWAVRQQATGPKPWVMLLWGLLLGQVALGFFQSSYLYPEYLRRLSANDATLWRELRGMGIEPDSTSAWTFRARLEANQPFGTFGHPNSLAGFVVLTLPLLVASVAANLVAARAEGKSSARFGRLVAWIPEVTFTIFVLLLLTRIDCVSAWVGTWSALVVMVLLLPQVSAWMASRRWWILALGIAGVLLLALALGGGGFDLATHDSLRYRLEWWQGTLLVLRDHPWTGVGFGNFRDAYLLYKSPFSSEEVRDPHNFVLELWACAGPGALLAYFYLLLGSLHAARLHALTELESTNNVVGSSLLEKEKIPSPTLSGMFPWWVWSGVLGALVLLILLPQSPLEIRGLFICGTSFLAVGLAGYCGWLGAHCSDTIFRRAIYAGAAGFHIHCLAAGGIGYPGLLLPVWILLAVAASPDSRPSVTMSPAMPKITVASWLVRTASVTVAVALGISFLLWHYFPLLRREQIRLRLRITEQDFTATDTLGKRYLAIAETLPGDGTGWVELALYHTQCLGHPRRAPVEARRHYTEALAAWRRALAVAPARGETYRSLAWTHLAAIQAGLYNDRDPAEARNLSPMLEQAEMALEQAVRRYPHSATRQWEYGCVSWLRANLAATPWSGYCRQVVEMFAELGRQVPVQSARWQVLARWLQATPAPTAGLALRRALELDQTPHLDKKLTAGQRWLARTLLETNQTPAPTGARPDGE